MSDKEATLAQLKVGFKAQIEKDYAKDPDKVKNTDIEKTTDELMKNIIIKTACAVKGIKRNDIVKLLTEIKNEVVK